jgi:hypothetical protein
MGRSESVAPLVEIEDPIGILVMEGYLVVAKSQLSRHADFGGNGARAGAARMSIMPAALEAINLIAGGR